MVSPVSRCVSDDYGTWEPGNLAPPSSPTPWVEPAQMEKRVARSRDIEYKEIL